MEPAAPPQRKLRIRPRRSAAPKIVSYGYGEQLEGTPREAALYWAGLTGQTYEQYRASLAGPRYQDSSKSRSQFTRGRVRHTRTISLPRTRSREQSHAARRTARSTPKAASRSGDSGDSSPPGSSPAALAALLLFLLRGVSS